MAEAKEQKDSDDLIFDGMLSAINDDEGPRMLLNISSLSEREAIATVIHGITAVGLGEEENKGLFGPIPVPYNNNFRTLIYVFYVSPSKNDPDNHSKKFCAFFFIFKTEMIRYIANVYSMIESLLDLYQENYFRFEDDLQIGSLKSIYHELIKKLALKPKKRLFCTNDNITIEYEESKIRLGNEMTALIVEKEKRVYAYIPRNLAVERKEEVNKILKQINKTEYQKTFKIINQSSKKSFLDLLSKNNIEVVD
ncbi:MAG: hypothetical protein FK734_12705 [Asgard group archaeon]|nr:hypothetical protein [Asgard group archaeon]